MMMRPSEFQTAFWFAAYGFWETPCIRRGFCFIFLSVA